MIKAQGINIYVDRYTLQRSHVMNQLINKRKHVFGAEITIKPDARKILFKGSSVDYKLVLLISQEIRMPIHLFLFLMLLLKIIACLKDLCDMVYNTQYYNIQNCYSVILLATIVYNNSVSKLICYIQTNSKHIYCKHMCIQKNTYRVYTIYNDILPFIYTRNTR